MKNGMPDQDVMVEGHETIDDHKEIMEYLSTLNIPRSRTRLRLTKKKRDEVKIKAKRKAQRIARKITRNAA